MQFAIGKDFTDIGDGRRLWRGEYGLGTIVARNGSVVAGQLSAGNGSVVAGQLSAAAGSASAGQLSAGSVNPSEEAGQLSAGSVNPSEEAGHCPAIAKALDGYGFIFSRNETVTTFTRRKTYEEVMSTAEFDSCGRVIHTEGGMVTEKRTSVEWICEGAGYWQNGAPAQPAENQPAENQPAENQLASNQPAQPDGNPADPTANPTGTHPRLILNAVYKEYMFGKHSRTALDHDFDLSEAGPDGHLKGGWYELHVWPLPEGRVLCLEHHGAVFILAPGESFIYNPDKNDTHYKTYIYTLNAI